MNRSYRKPPFWDGLNVIEQGLLTRAAAEGVLHEIGAPGPLRAGPELDAILTAVWRLLGDDLICLYRVADGYPDVKRTEIDEVLRVCRSGHADRPAIGMYLTPKGEDLVGGALSNLITDQPFELDHRRSG
jgi:hypothetical protein